MTDSTTRLVDLLAGTDQLDITTVRPDGSPRAWVPIWFVILDGHVFVRSYRGTDGAWYRHATAAGNADVRAAAGTYRVRVEPVGENAELAERIDQTYRTKYARYPSYLPPMLTGQAKATTLRLDRPDQHRTGPKTTTKGTPL